MDDANEWISRTTAVGTLDHQTLLREQLGRMAMPFEGYRIQLERLGGDQPIEVRVFLNRIAPGLLGFR